MPDLPGEYLVNIDTISSCGTTWYSFKTTIK